MQLDEVPDEREPETKARELPVDALIVLAEPLEQIRKEVGRDAGAGVADRDVDDPRVLPEPHGDPAPLRRELHRVGEQVPEHLLQPILHHPGPSPAPGSTSAHERQPFRLNGRPDHIDRGFQDRHQIARLELQPGLARDDRRDVEHVAHEPNERAGISIDQLERAGAAVFGDLAFSKHLRVAHQRVQGRAQLMRQRRQELVLQPVGFFELLQKAFPLADVARDLRDADDLTVLSLIGDTVSEMSMNEPFLRTPHGLEMLDPDGLAHLREDEVLFGQPVRRDDGLDRLPHDLVGRVSEHAARRRGSTT